MTSFTTPPTAVSGSVATAADFNILGDDITYLKGIADGVTFSACKATRAAGTSISDSTWSVVTWTAEDFDYGSWHSSGTNFVVPTGAIPSGFTSIAILAIPRVIWAANATGYRSIRVLVNGASFMSPTVPGFATDSAVVESTGMTTVAAGDIITAELYQNSGGALSASSISLTIARFAPAA